MVHNSDTRTGLRGLSCQQIRAVTGAIEDLTALMTNRQAPAVARVQAATAILDAALDCRLAGLTARLEALEAAMGTDK